MVGCCWVVIKVGIVISNNNGGVYGVGVGAWGKKQ